MSIDVPASMSQQRHPTSGSATATGGCHDDGRDVAAAAAVISAAVGKQLFDNGASSVLQQAADGSKIAELTSGDVIRDSRRRGDVTAGSGNPARREPVGASATKAKSEIQKFYQIKEKVPCSFFDFVNSIILACNLHQNSKAAFAGMRSKRVK